MSWHSIFGFMLHIWNFPFYNGHLLSHEMDFSLYVWWDGRILLWGFYQSQTFLAMSQWKWLTKREKKVWGHPASHKKAQYTSIYDMIVKIGNKRGQWWQIVLWPWFSCSQWEAEHAPIRAQLFFYFFFLGLAGGGRDSMSSPMCSHCVPINFPMCSQ
jgi:hypothetical protein